MLCLRLVMVLALVLASSSCSYWSVLTEAERAQAAAGGKCLVLMRVRCRVDGRPYEPFSHDTPMDNVSFGVGTFETVGRPQIVTNRFLPGDTRKAGWTCLLLEPGTHYLAVRPPQRGNAIAYDEMLQTGPRWRIDIGAQDRLLYVGTLSLEGEGDPLIFGGPIMSTINEQRATVVDERAQAARVLAQWLPDAGRMNTRLMRRWQPGEPIIIRMTPP